MGTIATAKAVAHYQEPAARGLPGCHNCQHMRMMPSQLGFRRPECSRLGFLVSPLAICKHHQVKAISGATL